MPEAPRILADLDPRLGELVRSGQSCLYSTMTARDTPVGQLITPYPGPDGETLDHATGVSYPLKAERVRRNPRTSWLLESRVPGEPVAVVAALGAVRDADIQAATDRYVEEFRDWSVELIGTTYWESMGVGWDKAREAVWYWPRIWVQAIPTTVWWWPDGDVRREPQVWKAPEGVEAPTSDPAPAPLRRLKPPQDKSDWRPAAAAVVEREAMAAYLMIRGPEGHPWPTRAGAIALIDDGFELELPGWCPTAPQGEASLHFAREDGGGAGATTFIGSVEPTASGARIAIARGSADVSLAAIQPQELWDPHPEMRATLMERLEQQLERRGQPIPIVRLPEERTDASAAEA